MNKHTPGPWVWVRQDGMCWMLIGAEGSRVCDDGSAWGEYAPRVIVPSANASLIAAAPDMLKALLYWEKCMNDDTDMGEMIEQFTIMAYGAIAKATGQSS